MASRATSWRAPTRTPFESSFIEPCTPVFPTPRSTHPERA
jgi:hypothetical protein